MMITKALGAAGLATVVTVHAGASEPLVAEKRLTPEQSVDKWYRKNQG